jgi:hypothetical protein
MVSAVTARLLCPSPVSGGWMTVIWRAGGRTAVCSAPAVGDSASCQAAIPTVSDDMSVTVMFEAGGRVYQETISSPGTVKQSGRYIRSAPARPTGKIKITHIYPIGIGGDQSDEWIQFENLEEFPVDMTGWVLKTQANEQEFIFGPLIIGPGGRCRIYTSHYDETWCGLNWNSPWEVWGDKRDVGVLFNSLGDEVSRVSYNENEFRFEWQWVETTTVTIPGSQFGAPPSTGGTPSGASANPGGANLLNLPF